MTHIRVPVRGLVALGLALATAPAASAATPVLTGSVSDPAKLSGALAVAVSGHFAYAPSYYGGALAAVDLSNPAGPVIAGQSAETPSEQNLALNADTVTIAGGYAYVVSKNRNASKASNDDGTGNSLSIFDIHTNPAVPVLAGQLHDSHALFGAYGVAVQGGYAYVAAQGCLSGQPCPDATVGNDLAVIDVTDPASPRLVGVASNSAAHPTALTRADSVAVSGRYAYVTASASRSLTVVDISNPAAPAVVAQLQDPQNLSSADDVAIQGTDAFVADQTSPSGALAVVDISNPLTPHLLGLLSAPQLNGAYRVRVSGRYAYVAGEGANAVSVLDVSNPQHPVLAATAASSHHLSHVTGLDVAAGGRYIVASSPFLSTESIGAYPPFPLSGQPGAPTATGTISVIDTDPGPVAVRILSPASRGVYARGLAVRADYTCTPSGLAALTSCTGPVPSGARIDTHALGRHTFAVVARDAGGQSGQAAMAYTVIPDPTLTGLRQLVASWREPGTHGRARVGTVFHFRLGEASVLTLTFTRLLGPGRRAGRRCVPLTRRNRHRRACERTAPAGTVRAAGRRGADAIAFAGRVGRRRLRPGTYTVAVTATAGGASVTRRLTFTIVG